MPYISKKKRLQIELEGKLAADPEELSYSFYCILAALSVKDIEKADEMLVEVIEAYIFENGMSILTQTEILGSFFIALWALESRVGSVAYEARYSDNSNILMETVGGFFEYQCLPYLEALRKKHGDMQYE
jgi:hypothetical protein